MKALILVGGFGTRLRPLTFYHPKPTLPFVNKPIIEHQVRALADAGVKEIILAISFQPTEIISHLSGLEEQYKVKITMSKEDSPLGTAGPVKLAEKLLKDSEVEDFFLLNSDITCSYPLKEMLSFHRKHKKEGTIMVTKVSDPSKYGVIVTNEDNQINLFVEKPKEFISNKINAGIYILNRKICNRIELRPTSIEKEIFPRMVGERELYTFTLEGFWADIGQPKDFLKGTALYLDYQYIVVKELKRTSSSEYQIIGNVCIDPSAHIGKGCVIGPNVVIGPDCVIEEGVRIKNSTLFRNVRVESSSMISDSIISYDCVIGRWVRIEGLSVIAEDVVISDELFFKEVSILPHKTVTEGLAEGKNIIMQLLLADSKNK